MEQGPATVRNSDGEIDFDDVFGGPPTWTRYSYSGSRMKPWEESTCSPTGTVDRPGFGESCSSPRRRTSGDFFDDVFRSDESVRSVDADFSSPAKMTKAVDVPVFGSNLHTRNSHLSRFSSSAKQILRSNLGPSPGQKVLSRESSSVNESLYSTRSTENETGHNSKPRTGFASMEFHFSIYKWANVGVPVLMSTLKGSSKVSALSIDNMQDSGFQNDDLPAEKQDMNPVSGINLTEVIEKERLVMKQEVTKHEVMPPSSLFHDEVERQGYEEAVTEAVTKEKMGTVSGKKKLKAKKMNYSKKAESNKSGVGSPKNRVKGMVKDFFKMSNQERAPKTKADMSFRWKTRSRKQIHEEVDDIISNLDINVESKTDASKTTKLASESPAESVKWASYASISMPLDGKVPAENVNIMPDASFMANEETKRSNKQKFAQNSTIRKLEDINFQRHAAPASGSYDIFGFCISESTPNGSKASVETIDDPSFDNLQVEELGSVEDKPSRTREESEAIMALDSKIHMWSSGRTGNIRSLLSTLQLVLWADSGWKPVALVDILEANALKKAYNRAMLCLHPDKLQQKGVDAHKKYIAKKVFDILQEAWDHLNSLGGVIL